jgi:hypothetical protein
VPSDALLAAPWVPGALFVLHLAATLYMVGVIWFVQLVHYPLFAGVGAAGFGAYAAEHGRRTTWVVAGPMLVELATAVALLWRRPAAMPATWAMGGAALVVVVWASTVVLQAPRHTELGGGWDARAHARLVRTNWLRTVAWTARGALVAAVAVRALTAGAGGPGLTGIGVERAGFGAHRAVAPRPASGAPRREGTAARGLPYATPRPAPPAAWRTLPRTNRSRRCFVTSLPGCSRATSRAASSA